MNIGSSPRNDLSFSAPTSWSCHQPPLLLPAGAASAASNGPSGALSGSGIGAGALSPQGKSPTVAQSSEGTYLDESSYVAVHLSTKVSFDCVFLVDDLPYAVDLRIGKLRNLRPRNAYDICSIQDADCKGRPYAIDAAEGCICPLVIRYVYASYSDHSFPP